jgi:hypothetical protein
MLFGLIFVLAGFCAVAIFSFTNDLSCRRIEPALIRCTRQSKLFGLYDVDQTEFKNISRATVAESCDEDGCACRVELQTEEGMTPLNQVYMGGVGGCRSQQNKADTLNTFLIDNTAVTITIADTTGEKLMTFLPLLFVFFGVVILVKGGRDFLLNFR